MAYWKDLAGMTVYSKTDKSATLGYSETQAKLVLQDAGEECLALFRVTGSLVIYTGLVLQ